MCLHRDEKEKDKGKKRNGNDIASMNAAEESNTGATFSPKKKTVAAAAESVLSTSWISLDFQ